MSDSDTAADAPLGEKAKGAAGPDWLVRHAPSPDLPDERDKSGRQRGMIIALAGGGLFWGAVAAAAIYFLRR